MKKILVDEKTNLVENIIIADDTFTLPDKTLIDYVDGVSVGDLYVNGKFEKDLEKIEKERLEQLKTQAKALLEKTDMVALRCLKAGVEFPNEWVEYIIKLRQVINGELNELPIMPDYPEGS